MSPGKVTEESKITKVLKEMVLREQPGTPTPRPGTRVHQLHPRTAGPGQVPWEAAADIDFSKLHAPRSCFRRHEGDRHLREDLHLTWMLNGVSTTSPEAGPGRGPGGRSLERVATIQFKALETISAWTMWRGSGRWTTSLRHRPYDFAGSPPKACFPLYKKVGTSARPQRYFLHALRRDLSMLLDDLIAMGLDVIQPSTVLMDMAR